MVALPKLYQTYLALTMVTSNNLTIPSLNLAQVDNLLISHLGNHPVNLVMEDNLVEVVIVIIELK